MTSYTEKLEQYLQESDNQTSYSDSMNYLPQQDFHNTKTFKAVGIASNHKSATKKSPFLSTINPGQPDLMGYSLSSIHSPTMLNDITNSRHNNIIFTQSNAHLTGLLPPTGSISFTNSTKGEHISTAAAGIRTTNQTDFLPLNTKSSFGTENSARGAMTPSTKVPMPNGVYFKKVASPTMGIRVNAYNIEDFLPEKTFLKPINFQGEPPHNGMNPLETDRNLGFQTKDSQFSQFINSASNKINVLGDSTEEAAQHIPEREVPHQINPNDVSKPESLVSEREAHGTSFANAGQVPFDYLSNIGSNLEGKMDERSREEIQKFVKNSLFQGSKPKDTTTNDYADFLSRILIKLLENLSSLQKPPVKEDNAALQTLPEKIPSNNSVTEIKSTRKCQRLRIQHLEAINYVPEHKYSKEKNLALDYELFGSPTSHTPSRHEPYSKKVNFKNEGTTLDRPPVSNKASASKVPSKINSNLKQSDLKIEKSATKTCGLTSDIASLDELSDSSIDQSQQESEIIPKSRAPGQKGTEKSKECWENSKDSTFLSDINDSDFDFDAPKGKPLTTHVASHSRGKSENEDRFTFKTGLTPDQSRAAYDSRGKYSSVPLTQGSGAKKRDFSSNQTEEPGKAAGNTTAHFASRGSARQEKNDANSELSIGFNISGLSEKRSHQANHDTSSSSRTRLEKSTSKPEAEKRPELGAKKREVYIDENGRVVFTETRSPQEASSRNQEISCDRDLNGRKLSLAPIEFGYSGRKMLSPNFDASKDSVFTCSKSVNEEWSPSRVQFEYSISNSHVSRMNSIVAENVSRQEMRSPKSQFEAKSTTRDASDPRGRDAGDALFKGSLLNSAESERTQSPRPDNVPSSWRPVRFNSKEKIDEFLKSS